MSTATRYIEYFQSKIQEVLENEIPNIEKAAQLMAESCLTGGRIYVFGTGHSHLIAEEMYVRAGGLALVHAILPPEFALVNGMVTKSTLLERLEGYAPALIDLYHVGEKDTLMVVSNSGRNPVPVEMCLAAKAKGAKVVALTSMKHSATCTSRHSRNNRCGQYIGEGLTYDEAQEKIGMVVEGYHALDAAMALSEKYDVDMPIISAVYKTVKCNVKPSEAIQELMSRAMKSELE